MSAQELAHVTVLLHEAVDALAVKPDGVYVAAVAVAFVGVEPAFDEAFAL